MGKNFYAVKRGRGGPAIYTTWVACEAQVKNFQDASYKGFVTKAEAEAFIGGGSAAVAGVPVAKKQKSADIGGLVPVATSSSAKPNAFTALMRAKAPASGGGGVQVGDIAVFTDGACAGNQNVATTNNPAGWGACVVEGAIGERPMGGVAIAELFGPVDLVATSPHFLGAEVASNNTGELSAVCEALRWLTEHEPSSRKAWICYDSMYAMNQATGKHQAHKNVALARRSHKMLAEARKKRVVDFLHVKGHSNHQWNDAADALANRGATGLRSTSSGSLPLVLHSVASLGSARAAAGSPSASASRKRPIVSE